MRRSMTRLPSLKKTLAEARGAAAARLSAELRVVVEYRVTVTVTVSARPAPPPRPEPPLPRIRPSRELVDRYLAALAAGRQLTFKVDDLIQPAEAGRRRRA